tara:strand:+ start:29920 stop:31590 length:1671 start_codon:yes stop_codon:yes gene_type:complete
MKKFTHLNNKIVFITTILIFFFTQLNFIYKGGTTYDADGLRFGSSLVIEKIRRILSLNFNFQDLPYSDVEYYGLIIILPAYVFAQIMTKSLDDFEFKNFITDDSLIYFFMHFFLLIYASACLFIICNKLSKLINFKTSFTFLCVLILTPSFSGHALFNLKDIPYALNMFIFFLFFIESYEKITLEKLNSKILLKLSFILSLFIVIRVNAIFFSFLLILCLIIQKKDIKIFTQTIFIVNLIKIYLLALVFLYFFTPSAWLNPSGWIYEALYQQFFDSWSGSTLTNGNFVLASNMNWKYLLEWLVFKLPLIYHLGILATLFYLFKRQTIPVYSEVAMYFVFLVILMFIIFKPGVYDGLRQFLFLIPFLALILSQIMIKISKDFNFSFKLIFIPLFFYLIFTQYGLGQYRYVYFNELVNIDSVSIECKNIDGCGFWPSDYWGYSGKELAEYLNRNLINGEIKSLSRFAWRDNLTSVLVCRPAITVNSYLDKSMNFNFLQIEDFSRSTFYVTSFHRPRYLDDSCKFTVNNISYSCKSIYVLKKRIRLNEIPLAYINECRI